MLYLSPVGKVFKEKEAEKLQVNDDEHVETEWDEALANATEEELVDLAGTHPCPTHQTLSLTHPSYTLHPGRLAATTPSYHILIPPRFPHKRICKSNPRSCQ